jgi:hypothetical protein
MAFIPDGQPTSSDGFVPVGNETLGTQNDFGLSVGSAVPTQPIAAPSSPGFIMPKISDIPSGLYEGITRGIPEQIGKALQFSGVAPETGKQLADWAEAGKNTDPKSFVREGAEMIGPSVGVASGLYYGGKALSAVPHPAAKIIGVGMQALGGYAAPAVMGLSQAQQTRETAQRAGVPEGYAPVVNGIIETAGEFFGTKYLGKAFGLMPIPEGAKETFKSFLKVMLTKVVPVEILTEMGQAFGQSYVEKQQGIRPDANPLMEALDVIGPTLVMTTLMGAAGATHKAYRGDFAKKDDVLAPNANLGLDAQEDGAVQVPEATIVQQKAVDPYTMTPETQKTWQDIIAGEATNTPSAATKSVAVDQEVAPPGTIVRAGEHDFVIDSHAPEGATGRRMFNSMEGGLPADASDAAKALYNRAQSELEFLKRQGSEVNPDSVVEMLATDPKAPPVSSEEVASVIAALNNPAKAVTKYGEPETYGHDKLTMKTERMVPLAQKNLTIEELQASKPKTFIDIVNFVAAKKAEGMNVKSVVDMLKDEDAMASFLPKVAVKERPSLKFPNAKESSLKQLKPKTMDEIEEAIDAGAKYEDVTGKDGERHIDYFPKELGYHFKDKDYKSDAEREIDTKEKINILKEKLKSFYKRRQFKMDEERSKQFGLVSQQTPEEFTAKNWKLYQEKDDKGKIKFVGIARMAPKFQGTTAKWIGPKVEESLKVVAAASKERRAALLKDVLATLKTFVSMGKIVKETVAVRPGEINLVDDLQNYIDTHRDTLSAEEIASYEAQIGGKKEATEKELESLFGPAIDGETSTFDIEGSTPAGEGFDMSLAAPNVNDFGVRKSMAVGQVIQDIESYLAGKGKLSNERFQAIISSMIRFQGGREIIDNFLKGNKTATEVIQQAKVKKIVEAGKKQDAKDKVQMEKAAAKDEAKKGKPKEKAATAPKIEFTKEQWREYVEKVRELYGKMFGKDFSTKKVAQIKDAVVGKIPNGKKNVVTEEQFKAINTRIREDMAGVSPTVVAKEAPVVAEKKEVAPKKSKEERTAAMLAGKEKFAEMRMKAKALKITVPKGTKMPQLAEMIAKAESGATEKGKPKNKGKAKVAKTTPEERKAVAEAQVTVKGKPIKGEVSEEETQNNFDAVFGVSGEAKPALAKKEPTPSSPAKPIVDLGASSKAEAKKPMVKEVAKTIEAKEYKSLPEGKALRSVELKSPEAAQKMVDNFVTMQDGVNKLNYEIANIGGKYYVISDAKPMKVVKVEPVVPISKEREAKNREAQIAKQKSAIRTTLREAIATLDKARDIGDPPTKAELDEMTEVVYAKFKQKGESPTLTNLIAYAAQKIQTKYGLSTSKQANAAMETMVKQSISQEIADVFAAESGRGGATSTSVKQLSREEEIAKLAEEQALDASDESLRVTEIPDIDNLTGREIYEFMRKDIESRIPLVKDPVTRDQMKNMLKIDLSRTGTRWKDAKSHIITMMDRFGKTARQTMATEYKLKVMDYVNQMSMVAVRLRQNPAIAKLIAGMVKDKKSKNYIDDFVWTISSPFYYSSKDIDAWFKKVKDPTRKRTDNSIISKENLVWIGKHWALRKDIHKGNKNPVYYYLAELTPELRNELGITDEAVDAALKSDKAVSRPKMGDKVISITTEAGNFELIIKPGKVFVAFDKETLAKDNIKTTLINAGMETAYRGDTLGESRLISANDILNRRIPFSITVESLQKELPTATHITEKSPGVFHVGWKGFSIEIRNGEVQYYARDNGEPVKINGRWKIKEGGRPIIEISKLAKDLKDFNVTIRHEILHMVFDIYLTKSEQNRLYDMYRTNPGQSLKDIQELIAEDYGTWMPGLKTAEEKATLFTKLMNGARDLLWKMQGVFTGRQNFSTKDELFAAIRSGRIFNRPLQLNISLTRVPKGQKIAAFGGGELPTTIKGILSDPSRDSKREWAGPVKRIPLMKTLESSGIIDYSELETNESLRRATGLAATNQDSITTDRAWYDLVLDWAKGLVKSNPDNLPMSGKEVGRWEHNLSNPLWLGTRFIEWTKALRIGEKRSADFQTDKYYMYKRTDSFQRLVDKSVAKLDPLFVYGSAISHSYLTREELSNPATIEKIYKQTGSKLTNYNLTNKEIDGYLEVVAESKRIWADKLTTAKMALVKPFLPALSTEQGAELMRLHKLLISGKEPANINEQLNDKQWRDYYEQDGKKRYANKLKSAYGKIKGRFNEVQAKYADKQFLDGYAPLRHGSGPFYVAVKRSWTDPQGKSHSEWVWSHHAQSEQHAAEMTGELNKLLKQTDATDGTFTIHSGRSQKPEDSVFFMVGDMNTVRVIDLALANIKANEDASITMEQATELMDNLTDAIVDIRRARGAGASDISRHVLKWDEMKTVGGYQDTGFRDIWNSYFNGYYGMKTKFGASIEYMELLKDVKRNTPQLFNDLVKYAQDNLRNKDQYDRSIGLAKNAIFYWYLGGKLSTAVLQMTQNFAVAIPRMAMEMSAMKTKDGMFAAEGYFFKAMKDIAVMKKNSPNVSAPERAMLEYFERRGELMARFMQTIKIEVASGGNKMGMKALEVLGWPMTYSEIFNRKSTALAYYRFLKKQGGRTEEQIYDKVEDFINKTHWLYGPANAPAVARGTEAINRIAQLAYTFRPFSHNYVLALIYNIKNEQGNAGLVYAARSFAWLTLLGGLPALPWLADFIEYVTKMTGVPIRMEARKMVKEAMGDQAEKFWSAGALGMLGGMDMSAAIRPVGLPSFPWSDDFVESTMGVSGGLIKKAANAAKAGAVGDWVKMTESLAPTAMENMIKAYRLNTRGVTTSQEKQVFGPDFKQIKLEGLDYFKQGFGFKPYGYSQDQMDLWESKVVQEHWNKGKQKLEKERRLAINDKDYTKLSEVARKYTNFNLSIPKELTGIVTPIRWGVMDKPDKKMGRMWGAFGPGAPE